MLLNRVGNKESIAAAVVSKFPDHVSYIEPFFGSGGIFFHKKRARYNILNDLDSDILNLFQLVRDDADKLYECIVMTPFSHELYQYWKHNMETDPFYKAVRFLYMSNFSIYGKTGTMHLQINNYKDLLLQRLKETAVSLMSGDIAWTNLSYEDLFKAIKPRTLQHSFIYSDPPYIGTTNNYGDGRKVIWKVEDAAKVIEAMIDTGCEFAMSEYASDNTKLLAKDYGLHIHFVANKRSIHNRNTEILLTNYVIPNLFEDLDDWNLQDLHECNE